MILSLSWEEERSTSEKEREERCYRNRGDDAIVPTRKKRQLPLRKVTKEVHEFLLTWSRDSCSFMLTCVSLPSLTNIIVSMGLEAEVNAGQIDEVGHDVGP